MAKFRVLRGLHAQAEGPANEEGRRKVKTYEARTIRNLRGQLVNAGDVVESDADLTRHNRAGHPKFELVPEVEPIENVIGPVDDDLGTKTLAELRALAAEQQIDLGEAVLKADVVETIRSALVEA